MPYHVMPYHTIPFYCFVCVCSSPFSVHNSHFQSLRNRNHFAWVNEACAAELLIGTSIVYVKIIRIREWNRNTDWRIEKLRAKEIKKILKMINFNDWKYGIHNKSFSRALLFPFDLAFVLFFLNCYCCAAFLCKLKTIQRKLDLK